MWSKFTLPWLFFCLAAAALPVLPAEAAQKPDTWIELTSAHFTVYSNDGEKTAARIAVQFEQIRDVFLKLGKTLRVDPGQPILILAAKDEKSLAALLPEFYQDKERARPSGMFIPREERNYIVLRTDVEGDLPYHTLYHEYTHQVTNLNATFLPTWFSEGYSEFFGNSRITGRRVSLGWASEGNLAFLQQSRLLPLEELFRVDHKSPYYNEAKKVNIFYAQSWALIHMLFFAPEYRDADLLSAYLRYINQGQEPVEAGRRAFGDLTKVQRRLESYIRGGRYYHLEMNSPIEEIERAFSVRSPSEAETAALFGAYHLARGQTNEAKQWLDRAVKLEPDLVAANEALGMLHIQAKEYDQAAPYLDHAVQLNAKSFLTYFYHANLLLQGGAREEYALAQAEESYKKCTQLNKNFAPAYAALAHLYGRRRETLDSALQAARTAASLDPSVWQHQLTLAITLAKRSEFAEARTILHRVAARAGDPEAPEAAASALGFVADSERYEAERLRYEAEKRRNEEEQRQSLVRSSEPESTPVDAVALVRRPGSVLSTREPSEGAAATAEASPSTTEAPAPSTSPAARVYSMRGDIVAVDCRAAPQVTLTLTMGRLSMKLHATNLSKVTFLTSTGAPQSRAMTCAQLRGMAARIQYALTNGELYDGEISSIASQE
jgi:tetratricopeptide (TPR) repeat protein